MRKKRMGWALFPNMPVLLSPNELISQYKCVNLPKTDDNNWTHENDANALSWYMVNDFFLASAL